MSIDPVTFMDKPYPGQFNRYAYTWNDPINANDPDGEFVNFVAKFVVDVGLEVAIQAASGQSINVGSALKSSAKGVLDPTKTVRKAAKLAKLSKAAVKANRVKAPAGKTRVRHFTSDSGAKGIHKDGVIKASDQNSVFAVPGLVGTSLSKNDIIWNKRGTRVEA